MRYVVLVPISHNGQAIPDGALVNHAESYGLTVKTPLPIARLLERKRIAPAPVVAPAPAPAVEREAAATDPVEPEAKPKAKEKKF